MRNETNIKIPSKYHVAIDSVYQEHENGYFVELKNGYISEDTESGVIHEYTQKELIQALKWIREEV